MFTPQQEIIWWCDKWKFIKAWIKHSAVRSPNCQRIAMENYALVLISVFTFLFNERLGRRLRK